MRACVHACVHPSGLCRNMTYGLWLMVYGTRHMIAHGVPAAYGPWFMAPRPAGHGATMRQPITYGTITLRPMAYGTTMLQPIAYGTTMLRHSDCPEA